MDDEVLCQGAGVVGAECGSSGAGGDLLLLGGESRSGSGSKDGGRASIREVTAWLRLVGS